MKHIISVLVDNKPGVLARVAGLFSARGYNICSLAVGETEDPAISRMTIVSEAADIRILEQIIKQLRKLIDTITVTDLTRKDFLDREMVLLKVKFPAEQQRAIAAAANKFNAKIVKHNRDFAVFELCAASEDVESFLKSIKQFEIVELMRTGRVAVVL
ncbi:MAG: acetolactate synthase small subunit [Candidatus Omnitrophota bacterium]|jgi:acetolactate synthase-1/3 small subunit